jgi:Zn-dependent protease with chaperone function
MTMTHASSKILTFSMVLVLFAAQTLAVTGGPQFPDPGSADMSREQQIQLGFDTAAQVYQQMPVLPDSSPETQYIRQLGQRLAATIPPQHSWPFEFHVIPQKEINAFALPGGPMFVNVGTITAATSEAELAGVMAHEMAHVYMQHSAKQATKTQWTSTLFGLAGAILGATTGGVVGQLAQLGIQFGEQGVIMKYSRTDEAQADAVGAIILYKAGYNPQALADFFKTLEGEGGQPPEFLSDHPNPGNREAAIEKEIQPWPPKDYRTSEVAFNRAREQASKLKTYTGEEIAQSAKSGRWAALNKQNGAVFKAPPGLAVNLPASATGPTASAGSMQSVLPSSRLVTADLGPVKIAHPDNWQIFPPKQQGANLIIAPQAGLTDNGVGYGVVINGVSPKGGQRMSLDDVTSDLVQSFQKGSGLQPLGSPQSVSVAGVQGRSVAMQSVSPFPDANGRQQKERDWLVTVPRRDGSVLYFVFVAPQSEFDRFRPTYENMLRSAQF